MSIATRIIYKASLLPLLVCACWALPHSLWAQDSLASAGAQEAAITGKELWAKTIAYHDPHGNWKTFVGKVHLVSTLTDSYGEEELEMRKPDDFYQSTRLTEKIKAAKGVKHGACFNAVNDNQNPSAEQIKEYDLDCESARMMKEHHTCHLGLPMELKLQGMEAEAKVTWENFQGQKCYVLKLVGKPEAVKHSYYAGTWILYIDPVTYAMRGMRVQTEGFRAFEVYNAYIVVMGEIEVGGIKIPQIKNYFDEDDSHWLTDAFTVVKEAKK